VLPEVLLPVLPEVPPKRFDKKSDHDGVFSDMSRRLRYVPAGHPVEITQRTFQGRFLLRPSTEMKRVVLGVLGRAVRRYRMPLHSFAFLSNHYHLTISPRDAAHQAAFLCFLNGNLAREIRHLTGWTQKIWGRRYASVPITRQRKAQVARLRYALAQGVKEGLVARALEWPGASGLAQLLDPNAVLSGIWYDRTRAYRLRLAGVEPQPSDWMIEETIELTPLPALARLSLKRRVALVRKLVAEIEREAEAERTRPAAGAEAVGAINPLESPPPQKRSIIPLVHAATRAAWLAFREGYRVFLEAYAVARACLRSGRGRVAFPAGSFPSPAPFVRAVGTAPG
jgi:hypothetical protein